MEIEKKIKSLIDEALKNLGIQDVNFVVEHPEDLKNGDFSTNVAMVCAKNLKTNPRELAGKIKAELSKVPFDSLEKIEVAGAGFINFYLSRKFFTESVQDILNKKENFGKNEIFSGKKIMVEYTDPNPFKPFHIGHLMTNAIGESIARILESSGAKVFRANYQGDVGLHVAKAFYGMQKKGMPKDMNAPVKVLADYIGESYVIGSDAYDTDEQAKKEIEEINKKIYARSDAEINEVYDWGFKVTMEAFEGLYKILGTKFDYYFLESKMIKVGEGIVHENTPKIFEESDGAIVFKAEKHDPKLHTRVFITSQGLPTYETKEFGLTLEKFQKEPDMNLSFVITANEQKDYMKVVSKALSLIYPEYENKMLHITHGMMRFAEGKMSSRKGNVVTGESLLNDVRLAVLEKIKDRDFTPEEKTKLSSDIGVSALKYSILKQSTGGDIIYDFEKSISFEGDSGPYLQYSFVRANSVIEKAKKENIEIDFSVIPDETFEIEKLLYRFPEIVERAAFEYEPHYIANYLIEIARAFNSFYGNNMIAEKGNKNSPYLVALAYAFSLIMKEGLHLLGIRIPERM